MKLIKNLAIVLFLTLPCCAQSELPNPPGRSNVESAAYDQTTGKTRPWVCADDFGNVISPNFPSASGPPNKVLLRFGNATQANMDPSLAPQTGVVTVLNNSNTDFQTNTDPGAYAFTSWSLSQNPTFLNSVVGLYGIGEAALDSGSYGNILIGPQGAQLDGISSPAAGATISSVKGVQAGVFHQGAGTTQFAIGVDVLTPGITGGGTVFDAIGIHVRPQVGAQNNFGLSIDGTYSGPNDYAIQTNSNARSKLGIIIEAAPHTPRSSSDTGTTGQIAWDANYIYIAVAPNTWKRVAISTW
jgi:hypothetical protein